MDGRKYTAGGLPVPQLAGQQTASAHTSSAVASGTALKDSINDLATHLPDQVVFADHVKELPYQKTFQGVLMFLDISGFTSLCEKYSMNPKNGTEQLTKTLNGYIEALVNEIISSDGDILKFAGDAILTLWRVDSFLKMKVTVAHVIKCALHIQQQYGEWTTTAGVKLRIKMGIASGEVMFTYLGNEEFCHYVTLGRAVDSVKVAESFCTSGDVVLSPSGWCHCAGLPVEKEVCSDNKHIKITEMYNTSIADDYETCRTVPVAESHANLLGAVDTAVVAQKSAREFGSLEKRGAPLSVKLKETADGQRRKSQHETGLTSGVSALNKVVEGVVHDVLEQTKKPFKRGFGGKISESLVVRKAIMERTTEAVNSNLRLYIAAPVIKKMEEHQPLEYLSEMRQVTIVFINLQLQDDCSKFELCQTLQQAFDTIYASVKKMQGCLSKVFMFDKGCTFLVVFGLPGFKHEKDCAHALLCSYRMKEQLDCIEKVCLTSIGVTTGSTFCGVVGHDHRHEYTVIGRKVNMAARLMMHYPDKVTCDNDTFHHSKLHKSNFTVMELLEMKGLQNVGTIRQFVETVSDKSTIENLRLSEYENPLIGREKEIEVFMEQLMLITSEHCDPSLQPQVVVFDGESGVGKTRMLEAVTVKALDEKFRVISCSLSLSDAKTPFYAVKNLLVELMDFDYDMPHQERERELFKTFSDPFIVENMCLLNDLLQLKLAPHQKLSHMDSKQRATLFHDLLMHIVHEQTADHGLMMFTIDDAQFMDKESWQFVSSLGHDMKSLVVMTLKTGSKDQLSSVATEVLGQKTTVHLPMKGLDRCHMTALACQLLGVRKIPCRLEAFLQEKSHGVPSWCSQMLKEMFYEGIIQTQLLSKSAPEKMVSSPPQYMSRKRRTSRDIEQEFGNPLAQVVSGGQYDGDDEDPNQQSVCIIAPGKNLDVGIPDSVKGMIQVRIDRMEEKDQLVMKSAAVLGMTFSRSMLAVTLPTAVTTEELLAVLSRLSQHGIIGCNTVPSGELQSRPSAKTDTPSCRCPYDTTGKYKTCKVFSFLSSSMQETAYDMLLEKIRSSLHKKAAEYLESKAHKCAACGGGGFFPEHMLASKDSVLNPSTSTETTDTTKTSRSDRSFKLKSGPRQRPHRTFKTLLDSNQMTRSYGDPSPDNLTLTGMEQAVRQQRLGKKRRSSLVARAIQATFKTRNTVEPELYEDDNLGINQTSSGKLPKIQESSTSVDTLANLDLRECQCMQILSRVYPQLVRHWRAAGDVENTVHFLMEAAAAAIAVYDNMQALSYMRDASQIMEDMNAGKNPFQEVSTYKSFVMDKWDEARLQSLIGQSLFHMGQMEESVPHFKMSLRILGTKQPRGSCALWVHILIEGLKQWSSLKRHSNKKSRALLAHRSAEQANCLSHIFHYHLAQSNQKLALLTVLQQLNKAEECCQDLHELLMAYACMMELCQDRRWINLGRRYEYKANLSCLHPCNEVGAEDLVSIAHLHTTSINMRLAWANIADAIDAGYTANRICQKLHDNDMRMQVLPVLAQALLLANRVVDTVDILKDLDFLSAEAEDILSRSWYYAGCLDIVLEAGFQLETAGCCMEFAQEAYRDPTFLSDYLPLFYLASSLALWHQRRMETARAEVWYKVAQDNLPDKLEGFMAIRAFCKLLECELVALSYSKHANQLSRANILRDRIGHNLQQLNKMCLKLPVFNTRRLHLKAYHSAISGKMKEAAKCLDKCLSLSMKTGSVLEMHWATHSQKVWFDPEAHAQQDDFWLSKSSTDMLDWHMANKVANALVKYSLPLPDWFDKL